MIMQIFSCYDCKAEFFGKPFFLKTKGEAIRGFQDVAVDENTSIGRHPADFTLFHIGEFDDATCEFLMFDAHVNLGTALEHLPTLNSRSNTDA